MSDGMGREPAYLSSHATNRYFIPNWGSFCRQMKLKMPLGCLSNTSRMPPKCPLGEIYKQQNNLFTADEACHVAINM